MLKSLLDFLFNRKGHPVQRNSVAPVAEAPYKLEPPVVTPMVVPPEVGRPANDRVEATATSGTWPFPNPVGEAEKEAKPMKPAVKAKSVRAKKAPVAAMTAAEKPATKKPATKKPAQPRAKRAPST